VVVAATAVEPEAVAGVLVCTAAAPGAEAVSGGVTVGASAGGGTLAAWTTH
jgi:hypothetical protein